MTDNMEQPMPGDFILDIGDNPDHNQRDRIYGFGFFDTINNRNTYSLMVTGERGGTFRSAWTHMSEHEVRAVVKAMSDWLGDMHSASGNRQG